MTQSMIRSLDTVPGYKAIQSFKSIPKEFIFKKRQRMNSQENEILNFARNEHAEDTKREEERIKNLPPAL